MPLCPSRWLRSAPVGAATTPGIDMDTMQPGPPPPSPFSSADIVSACFALPFERRLVLGTEDGRILLVNYVTGAILDESHPHSSEVGDGEGQGVVVRFTSDHARPMLQTVLNRYPRPLAMFLFFLCFKRYTHRDEFGRCIGSSMLSSLAFRSMGNGG